MKYIFLDNFDSLASNLRSIEDSSASEDEPKMKMKIDLHTKNLRSFVATLKCRFDNILKVLILIIFIIKTFILTIYLNWSKKKIISGRKKRGKEDCVECKVSDDK